MDARSAKDTWPQSAESERKFLEFGNMTLGGASAQRMDRRRPAVLAVDDVEANLVALRASLDDMGCDIVLARSGDDALRQLLRREFAVVLLDVQMPGMDGYEVAYHARRNHRLAMCRSSF